MQALADQQTSNMQQVNSTVVEMQNRIGQLDNTISALNTTMTAQLHQIMSMLGAQAGTNPAAPTAPQPVTTYT